MYTQTEIYKISTIRLENCLLCEGMCWEKHSYVKSYLLTIWMREISDFQVTVDKKLIHTTITNALIFKQIAIQCEQYPPIVANICPLGEERSDKKWKHTLVNISNCINISFSVYFSETNGICYSQIHLNAILIWSKDNLRSILKTINEIKRLTEGSIGIFILLFYWKVVVTKCWSYAMKQIYFCSIIIILNET